MGAVYHQDFEQVGSTLRWSEKQLKEYLGTYFPRSFIEITFILNWLASKPAYHNVLKNKQQFYILDVGSGTGGNLIGLLFFLEKYYKNIQEIYVISTDGNQAALKIQQEIVGNLFSHKTALELKHISFENRTDFGNKMNSLIPQFFNSYDVIMTCKVINEFYRKDYQINQGMYRTVLHMTKDLISFDVIILFSDITDSFNYNYGTYHFNMLMNKEFADFYRNNGNKIKPIFPSGCYFWINKCQEASNCFTQVVHDFE